MEEIKKESVFVSPEVKVVEISGQARLCQASPEVEAKAQSLDTSLSSYEKVYF